MTNIGPQPAFERADTNTDLADLIARNRDGGSVTSGEYAIGCTAGSHDCDLSQYGQVVGTSRPRSTERAMRSLG